MCLTSYLLSFNEMPWESSKPGFRQKVVQLDNDKLVRLVEFSDEFEEDLWCQKGHLGYVIYGEVIFSFSDSDTVFKSGDGFNVPSGPEHRHKAKVMAGKQAFLYLVECQT